MNHLSPIRENSIRVVSNFFENSEEIFACQGAPPVPPTLLIPVANLPPESMTPAVNLPPVSANNITLLTSYSELEERSLSICYLYYPKVNGILRVPEKIDS
jgi:hypothetical protein